MAQVISLTDYRAQHHPPGPPSAPPPLPPRPRRHPSTPRRQGIRPLAGLWVLLPAVMMLLAVATVYAVVVMTVLGGG